MKGSGSSLRDVRWERMFPDELERAFAECPAVYLTYGLCEPHGPHSVLGLDALKAHALCVRTAQASGGIVAPADFWNIHEIGTFAVWAYEKIGEVRPWLTAVPPWVHFKQVCYQIRAVDVLGFEAALLVTEHYGVNAPDLKRLVALLQPHFRMRIDAVTDADANKPGFTGAGESGDHAGKVETSLLWALEPECIDMSRLNEGADSRFRFAQGEDAKNADRRTGERMVQDQVVWLGKKVQDLLDVYRAQPTQDRQPKTFQEIEEIWSTAIEPELSSFESMQSLSPRDESGPPSESRWFRNWPTPNASFWK